MATVRHITSDLGLGKFQAAWFLLDKVPESSGRGLKIQLGNITIPLEESDVKIKLFPQKNY